MKYQVDNNLPFKLPMKYFRKGKERRYSWGWRYQIIDHKPIWGIVERVLTNNIGKSFDMAFHYYCTLVPKQYQNDFYNQFGEESTVRYRSYDRYYIDEFGLIQKNKFVRNKRPLVIKSLDYKEWYVHKIYNFKVDHLRWEDNVSHYQKCSTGNIWTFESKNDPLYRKLTRARYKRQRKENRDHKKRQKLLSEKIFHTSIALCKEQVKKQKELDILKRNAAGFDETSFIGEAYHGRKNKK